MKVLIDEQLPVKIKYRFNDTHHEVYTVRDMDWLGQKNGDLLQLMKTHNFTVLLTNDKNLYYQQKTTGLQLCIVNINAKTNRYLDIFELLPAIKLKLNEVEHYLLSGEEGYFIVS